MLPQVKAKFSQYAIERASAGKHLIRPLLRMQSESVLAQCKFAGLPDALAEVCAGLLASVVDDMVNIGQLDRTDFERTKRKQRILAATEQPAISALQLAIAASPINGRAVVAHWDIICEQHEIGKLAWLLGMDTELSYKYSKQREKRM